MTGGLTLVSAEGSDRVTPAAWLADAQKQCRKRLSTFSFVAGSVGKKKKIQFFFFCRDDPRVHVAVPIEITARASACQRDFFSGRYTVRALCPASTHLSAGFPLTTFRAYATKRARQKGRCQRPSHKKLHCFCGPRCCVRSGTLPFENSKGAMES